MAESSAELELYALSTAYRKLPIVGARTAQPRDSTQPQVRQQNHYCHVRQAQLENKKYLDLW